MTFCIVCICVILVKFSTLLMKLMHSTLYLIKYLRHFLGVIRVRVVELYWFWQECCIKTSIICYLTSSVFLHYLAARSSAIAEGPRDASSELKSWQLRRNSAETTCTRIPEQIEFMKLEG